MNIAIEYALRNGRLQDMLALPCTLLLERKKRRLAVVVYSADMSGRAGVLTARHWRLYDLKDKPQLPSCTDLEFPAAELFTNSAVVIPGHDLLPFIEEPFADDSRQLSELPHSVVQESQYAECLSNFLNPRGMQQARENWLWSIFEKAYCNSATKARFSSRRPILRRESVRHYDTDLYAAWMAWRTNILVGNGPVAPELAFARAYSSRWLLSKKPPAEIDDEFRRRITNTLGAAW